jgi:hypothetical protein
MVPSQSGRGSVTSTTTPPVLDPGALQVIRQFAGMLARNEDGFIQQLHHDIMVQIPDSTAAPDLDMWGICERLVQSLLWVATTGQPLHVIIETLHQVGARNWLDGFPDSYYGSVAHALVQTVRYLGGDDWSASTGSAWISYFMWIGPHLRAGAQQAAIQQATEQRTAAQQEAARIETLSRDPSGEPSHPS